jgi:ABC-2 type transport system ATP-binding protein
LRRREIPPFSSGHSSAILAEHADITVASSIARPERSPMSLTVSAPAPASAGAAPEGTLVAVRGLTKVFKDFWGRPKARAVDDVSFEVRRGEVFGLLGPNGSGKSTTVKLLLGLLHPTRGQIEVFGHSPRHVASKARIGYLPEESYLYRHLNPVETLEFFGNLFELPRADLRNRIEQLIEMVGLGQARTRAVGEFSKGMQRRIGLAQALINDPDLVILDEPTAGLDPIGCREVKDLILALARRGKTVILSSHLLADVEDVCDRVVIYYGGRIQAAGPLKDLLAAPDRVRITTPALSRETMLRVLDLIRAEVAADRVQIDVPTQNLESYFLGVVARARAGEAHTSGALSGGEVAPYLRGEAEQASAGQRVLERLTQAPPKEPPPAPAQPVTDEARLAGLTQSPAATTAAAPPPAPAVAPPVDLSKANEKLSSLTGPPRVNKE